MIFQIRHCCSEIQLCHGFPALAVVLPYHPHSSLLYPCGAENSYSFHPLLVVLPFLGACIFLLSKSRPSSSAIRCTMTDSNIFLSISSFFPFPWLLPTISYITVKFCHSGLDLCCRRKGQGLVLFHLGSKWIILQSSPYSLRNQDQNSDLLGLHFDHKDVWSLLFWVTGKWNRTKPCTPASRCSSVFKNKNFCRC